jgi:hypothetical protein
MSPRLALRFVVFSLIIFAILIGIASVLSRRLQQMETQNAPPATPSFEQQLAAMTMQLDGNGIGSQVISGTQITVKVAPYPPKAGQETMLVIAGTTNTGHISVITPTLFIAPDVAGNAPTQRVTAHATGGGSYTATGLFFPQAGVWLVRVVFFINATESSSSTLLLKAEP